MRHIPTETGAYCHFGSWNRLFADIYYIIAHLLAVAAASRPRRAYYVSHAAATVSHFVLSVFARDCSIKSMEFSTSVKLMPQHNDTNLQYLYNRSSLE